MTGVRTFLSFWLFAAPLAAPAASQAAQPVLIEVRRTFASPECDSGELHVDGTLVSLFQSDPAMFQAPDIDRRVVDGEAAAELYRPGYMTSGQMQSLVVREAGGAERLRILLLNDASFTPFSRRVQTRRLAPQELAAGYSVDNRTCSITSQPDVTRYSDDDRRLAQTANRLGAAVLARPDLATAFPAPERRQVVLVFTDRTHRLRIEYPGHGYEVRPRARSAAGVGRDDPCLFKGEHMSNTRVHAGGATTYQRVDDVVACPSGSLEGAPTLEGRRDVRYLSFYALAPCASVLGIPLHNLTVVLRGAAGSGGAVFDRCAEGFASRTAASTWTWD